MITNDLAVVFGQPSQMASSHINHPNNLPHRRSIRLQGYDYSQAGAYFVTICTQGKECLFGGMENGAMVLNEYGCVVRDEWLKTAEIRAEIQAVEFEEIGRA